VTSRFTLAAVLTVVALSVAPASAADDPANDLALEIGRIVSAIREVRATPSLDRDERLRREIEFTSRRQLFFLLYTALREQWGSVVTPADVAAAKPPNLAAVEQARTDVQPGATPSSTGTSSLVSKGSGPSYFGAALENGAFVREASATTTTFQANVVGILDALSSKGYSASLEDDSRFARFMRRWSLGVTVRTGDLDPDSTESAIDDDEGAEDQTAVEDETAGGGGVTAAIRKQLEQADRRIEQYSVRAVVGRHRRDPRDEDNRDALRKLMEDRGQEVLAAFEEALETLQISDEYEAWIAQAVVDLRTVPPSLLQGELVRQLNALCDVALRVDPGFRDHAIAAYQAYAAFASARNRILENIEKRPLFAVEYVQMRRAPRTSTVRFIAEVQKGRWDLTFNAAVSAYHQKPVADAPWYRDLQFAAEAGRPLGSRFRRGQPGTNLGPPVLAFGFMYERLSDAATVTFGGRNLIATPGNLYIGQIRVTLPMSTGVKLPVSVSVSNRTELLNEAQIRANIGFTFSFDAVASLLRP
jgi:hypothetical protein